MVEEVWSLSGTLSAKTAHIEPGFSWENGYVESFNARFRDELLNREIFTSLREAQILIEARRRHSNMARPHSALGYRPPAPETILHQHSNWTNRSGLVSLVMAQTLVDNRQTNRRIELHGVHPPPRAETDKGL